jgi:hypothetical protein
MFRGLSTLARLTPAALAPAVALCDEKSARGALADLIDKSEAKRGDGGDGRQRRRSHEVLPRERVGRERGPRQRP